MGFVLPSDQRQWLHVELTQAGKHSELWLVWVQRVVHRVISTKSQQEFLTLWLPYLTQPPPPLPSPPRLSSWSQQCKGSMQGEALSSWRGVVLSACFHGVLSEQTESHDVVDRNWICSIVHVLALAVASSFSALNWGDYKVEPLTKGLYKIQ